MLNFGLSLGCVGFSCPKPDNEMLENPHFDCGDLDWSTNEQSHGYTGSVSFANSKATLVAEADNPSYFSLVPSNQTLEPGGYRAKVIVSEINGTAKFSYKLAGTWTEAIDNITAAGTYEEDFVINGGSTTDIQIGHKAASAGDSITFDFVGVTKISNAVTFNGEVVTHENKVVTYGN